MTALISAEAECSVVEMFKSTVGGTTGGSQAGSLVRCSYEVECFAFEAFEPILGLGCGWNG